MCYDIKKKGTVIRNELVNLRNRVQELKNRIEAFLLMGNGKKMTSVEN